MARPMGIDRGDSAPQLGRSGYKKKVLDKRQHTGRPCLIEAYKVSHQWHALTGPIEGPAGDCQGQSQWQNQVCYSTLGRAVIL